MTEENFVEILLVEDNKNDAELALMALEDSNLSNHVVWLKNGKEALDFIFAEGQYADRNITNQPKVILLDLKMPKVGGLEVLKKIRSDQRTRKIPITILTSSKEERDIIESYELGVNSYIVKPVDFDQFIKSVKEIGYYWALINQPPK
jgi:CheY-like chemotaxis protein